MKNKFFAKKFVVFVAIIIIATILVGWGYQYSKNAKPKSPDTITLSQGTQARFESLYIGLNSVNADSAWLSFHKDDEEGSINKQVIAGETIEIYGYKIEIESVNKSFIFSFKPGSSSGNIKFIIKK